MSCSMCRPVEPFKPFVFMSCEDRAGGADMNTSINIHDIQIVEGTTSSLKWRFKYESRHRRI